MISLNMAVGSLSSQHAGRSPPPSPSQLLPSPEKDHGKPTWAAWFRAGAEAVRQAGPVPGLDSPPGTSAALSLAPRLRLFPRVPRAAKCHQMGSVEPQNLSSPSSGGQNSKVKGGPATLPPKVAGSVCPRPLSWLLGASGVLGSQMALCSHVSSHGLSAVRRVCLCVQTSPFRVQLYWIRVHPNDLTSTESPP